MKTNQLTIHINKPVNQVFAFTITPPNSTKWIPNIIKEETDQWPIRVGTVYKLQDKSGSYSQVTVVSIEENQHIEWISADHIYHCRYTYQPINENATELEYSEWVNQGKIESPFTTEVLVKLKSVIENQN